MKVFEESSIAGVKLRNRIMRSATHEGMGDTEGRPMPELTNLYTRLVKGGVGAIVTGFVSVQKNGRTLMNMRMFDDDRYIDDYQKLNATINELGTPVFLQLAHAGGSTASFITGEKAVSPSPFNSVLYMRRSRQLTDREIKEIINSFVRAIERAKKSGFSGVQLHAAHGFLLCQFLSPHVNKRQDQWGGTIGNRFGIIAEIMAGARAKVGSYPIFAKISAYDGDRGGMRLEESIRVAELFQKAGCDALEISCGGINDGLNTVRTPSVPAEAFIEFIPWNRSMPTPVKTIFKAMMPLLVKMHTPLHNYNVKAAVEIKKHVSIPIIVVGGIRRLEDIDNIISENKADYVAMSRPLIIEPNLVSKFKSGDQRESRCIDCGYCIPGTMEQKLRCYHGKLR